MIDYPFVSLSHFLLLNVYLWRTSRLHALFIFFKEAKPNLKKIKNNTTLVFNFGYHQKGNPQANKCKANKVSPDCSVCASSACASGCSSLKVCEIFFFFKTFFGSFLPSCLGIKYFLYYIYLSIYINISVCFFLIARSLDLLLSKIMRKKLWIVFCNFPHSLFKCGTTSAAESPHPHLSNDPSLIGNHMHHGGEWGHWWK